MQTVEKNGFCGIFSNKIISIEKKWSNLQGNKKQGYSYQQINIVVWQF